MKIFCESPTIILNDKFKHCFLGNGYYYKDGELYTVTSDMMQRYYYEFPYYLFSKKRYVITSDKLDYIYTVDIFGEVVPCWIEVPCGKCDICRHKKSKEWCFRAVCESQTSTTIPLFVTLTYNNQNYPIHGVSKDEIQRFMKRLRITLDRKGIEHNLRYFVCGEYGHLSGRAHYHAIIWNFPNDENLSKCGIPIDIQADRVIRPAWNKGFVYVRRSDFGSVSYVMKYMRKGLQVPKGMNPGFFLSSRKNGGIGAQYLESVKDYYLQNPHILKMSVVDKYTGKVFESFIPHYFRDKLFPTGSKAIPQNVTKALKMLNFCCLYRKAVSDIVWRKSAYYEFNDEVLQEGSNHSVPLYNDAELEVFNKFKSVFHFYKLISPPALSYLSVIHDINTTDIDSLFKQSIKICDILTEYLKSYCFNEKKYLILQSKKEQFMNRFSIELADCEYSSEEVAYVADDLREKLRMSYLKEVI